MNLNTLISRILILYYFILRNWDYDEQTLDKCYLILKYDYYNVPMRLVLGDTYREMEMYDDAVDSYNEILEFSNNDFEKTESLNRIINLLYELEYFEDTIFYLNKLIEIEDNYYSFMNLGLCYYNLGRFNDALKYFKESNFIKPNVNAQLYISKCYYELKEYEESNLILNNLLESYPNSPEILLEKIYRSENYADKLKLCDKIIFSDYNFDDPFCKDISKHDFKEYFDDIKSEAYFIKSDEILEKKKDIQLSIDLKLLGLKLSKNYPEIFAVSVLYYKLNKISESCKYIQSYLEEYPNDENALYYMAKIYELKNDYSLAKQYYERILSIDDNCIKAKNRLDELRGFND